MAYIGRIRANTHRKTAKYTSRIAKTVRKAGKHTFYIEVTYCTLPLQRLYFIALIRRIASEKRSPARDEFSTEGNSAYAEATGNIAAKNAKGLHHQPICLSDADSGARVLHPI